MLLRRWPLFWTSTVCWDDLIIYSYAIYECYMNFTFVSSHAAGVFFQHHLGFLTNFTKIIRITLFLSGFFNSDFVGGPIAPPMRYRKLRDIATSGKRRYIGRDVS